ncbi:hypothetical protein [Streptomyces stelliscabiei]|uniref:hypothetical protein n=1 Tax=Streptomyces stelliscabiei TaxID=146820 RepID=UPI002FEFBACA
MSPFQGGAVSPPDPDSWRVQVRQWLAGVLDPARTPETTADADLAVFHNLPEAGERLLLERCRAYQRARFDAGYQALTLPADLGGAGLSAAHVAVFAEEESAFDVPPSTELISVTVRLVAMAFPVRNGRAAPRLRASRSCARTAGLPAVQRTRRRVRPRGVRTRARQEDTGQRPPGRSRRRGRTG